MRVLGRVGSPAPRFWPVVLRAQPSDARLSTAARSALSMGVPLLVLTLAGRPQEAGFAAFGAFTGLYAGTLPYRRRAPVLALTGAGFVGAVGLGSACASLASALGPVGWVAAIALVAGLAKWGCDSAELVGPGPWMFVFAFAASTQPATSPADVASRTLLAVGGAVVAWLIAMSGFLRDTSGPERRATAAAVHTTVRALAPGGGASPATLHLAHTALVRAERYDESATAAVRARLLDIAARSEMLLTDAVLTPGDPALGVRLTALSSEAAALRAERTPWSAGRRHPPVMERLPPRSNELPVEVLALHAQRAGHVVALRALTATRVLVGAGLAGALALVLGLGHPYWAPVSAAAVLQSTHVRMTWERSIQRGIGTAAGLLLGAVLLEAHPVPWAIAGLVVLMQLGIELSIGRNYALGVLFITPLTMLMSELAQPVAARAVLVDRLGGVALGILVGLGAALLVVHPRAAASLRHALDRCTAATTWATSAPAAVTQAAVDELRDALLELRTADVTARGETWPSGVSRAEVTAVEERAHQALATVRREQAASRFHVEQDPDRERPGDPWDPLRDPDLDFHL